MKYADHLHAQVRELLTEYSDLDIMWFDFSYPDRDAPTDFTRGKGREAWRSEELYRMVRELCPGILLNNRLDLEEGWDFLTPEQYQPRRGLESDGKPVLWEACQTFSGSWGYHRDEASWKSTEQLVRMLIDTVSKGGNLLLNVGPTARGELDYRAMGRLREIGEWMRRHGRSIYGCTAAPPGFQTPDDCRLTYNPDTRRLYVHVLAWPFKHLHLAGRTFGERVEYAQLLNDASEIRIKGIESWQKNQGDAHTDQCLTLELPVQKPQAAVPVIELFLK